MRLRLIRIFPKKYLWLALIPLTLYLINTATQSSSSEKYSELLETLQEGDISSLKLIHENGGMSLEVKQSPQIKKFRDSLLSVEKIDLGKSQNILEGSHVRIVVKPIDAILLCHSRSNNLHYLFCFFGVGNETQLSNYGAFRGQRLKEWIKPLVLE